MDRAQDAVQQAYLNVWRELPRLRDRDRYEAWLRRLLVNACYEEARRQRRWSGRVRALPIDGPAAPDLLVSVDDRDALERAFARLTPEQRAVVVLHHYVGLPVAAVAEAVGAPEGTVKSRIHYATQALRGAIAADATTSSPEVRTA
jgi:RNA polymerase sigma-70 factor (ECF subfamily)